MTSVIMFIVDLWTCCSINKQVFEFHGRERKCLYDYVFNFKLWVKPYIEWNIQGMCHGIVVACAQGLQKNQLKRAVSQKRGKMEYLWPALTQQRPVETSWNILVRHARTSNECKMASETGRKLIYITLWKWKWKRKKAANDTEQDLTIC